MCWPTGPFWEMNDFLFQKSDDIRAKNWTADDIAQRLELDLDKFRCCMDDPKSAAIIDSDIAEANGLGLKERQLCDQRTDLLRQSARRGPPTRKRLNV